MIALKGISRIESKLEKFKNRVRADGGTLLNYDTIQSLYSGLPALAKSDASMVMLPCGYKSGKVYGLNGNDFTFSRASNATRVNSSGLIELVSSNTPRFKYNPSTLAYEGLLLEKASTNLALWSEDFSNTTVWQAPTADLSGVSGTGLVPVITQNYGAAPDGTQTADRVQLNLNSGANTTQGANRSGFRQQIPITNGAAYVGTIYMKALDGTNLQNLISANGFNFVANGGTPSFSYENLPNGWIRIICATTSASTLCSLRIQLISYPGSTQNTLDILLWGSQLEQISVPTSYIPTTTASATRAADSLSIATGTWFVNTEGTLYADYNSFGSVTTNRIFSLNDGTANNSIHADLSSYSVLNGGVSQAAISTTGTSGKIATVYKANDFALVKNGGAASTDTSGTIPTVNTLKIGSASSAGNELNGTIKALAYFPTRRTNSELQTLTT